MISNRPMFSLITGALLVSLLTALSLPTQAKTIYVERWGQNNTSCGSKASPCSLISYAVSEIARKNDRIVVGPGLYMDNIVIDLDSDNDPLSGIKLESVAGRNATLIDADDSSEPVIEVQQPKVRVGKAGKGFALNGASSSAALRFQGAAINGRIEGNLAMFSGSGFVITGEKALIRFNIARDNTSNGFSISSNRAVIRDNLSHQNSGQGFNVLGESLTVERNKASRNNQAGFIFNTYDKGRIRNNVALQNNGSGLFVTASNKTAVTGNILMANAGEGIELVPILNQTYEDMQFNHNVAVDNNNGIDLTGGGSSPVLDTRVEGNHAIDNDQDGIQFFNLLFTRSLKSNNTYHNGSGCGIENNSGVNHEASKHFLGAPLAIDAICDPSTGDTGFSTAAKPSAVKVKQAAKL